MDAIQSDTWNKILGNTRAMAEAAIGGDWEAVVALEQARRPLLEAFFSKPPTPSVRAEIEPDIRDILSVDEHVQARSVTAREDIARQLQTLKHGRVVSNAYLTSGG